MVRYPGVGVDTLRKIDRICCSFEQAFRAGEHPRIEDFIESLPDVEPLLLLRELTATEIELCEEAGRGNQKEQLLDRFPQARDVIEQLLDASAPPKQFTRELFNKASLSHTKRSDHYPF